MSRFSGLVRRDRQRREEGQVGLLILGFTVIVMILIVLSIAVTSAQIARVRLFDVADAAALTAANSFDGGVYEQGIGDNLPVATRVARQAAADFLAAQPMPGNVTAWGLGAGTGAIDGRTAVVELTGRVQMPVFGPVLDAFGGSVNVTVRSEARATVADPVP